MKRFLTLTLTALLALSLSACKAKEETPPPPAQSAPVESGQPAEKIPELKELDALSASGGKAEGRVPAEDYKLPEEAVSMAEWEEQGGIALLAQLEDGDAAFYAVEGKEFSPALIRWGDALAEFDWAYATPRAVLPRLWCFDFDGDGEEELVVDCYVAGGAGVSMSDLHVVEKQEDGTLTACTFPARALMRELEGYLCLAKAGNTVYANLGSQKVDITGELSGMVLDFKEYDLGTGVAYGFEKTEQGMECRAGVRIQSRTEINYWNVAEITADVLYEDGKFTLDGFHLESN